VAGIKEEVILDAVREFMAEDLFGPDRLAHVRDELLDQASEGAWRERDSRLTGLHAEAHEVEQALCRKALRMEEHDDPGHQVVRLATRRIEELSGKERRSRRSRQRNRMSHNARRSKRSSPNCRTSAMCWRRPSPRN
jgi:hypothetical protein